MEHVAEVKMLLFGSVNDLTWAGRLRVGPPSSVLLPESIDSSSAAPLQEKIARSFNGVGRKALLDPRISALSSCFAELRQKAEEERRAK